MKRRDFIKHIPLGLAAASVPFSTGMFSGRAFGKSSLLETLLNTQSATDRVLVIINLQGGNDGLNTVIPFQDANYQTYRKNIGYVGSSDVAMLSPFKLSDTIALNPVMGITSTNSNPQPTHFMDLWTSGKLAVLQNVGYDNPNRSHFRATDIWNSATDSDIVMSTGWMARYLEDARANLDPTDPPAISISTATTLIFQGDQTVEAIAVSDPSHYTAATNYADDVPPATNYGAEVSFVRDVLRQSDTYGKRFTNLFDPSTNPNATKNTVTYPTTNALALQLQKVAWCINAGMKTRVYFVSQAGYDTHVNQNTKDQTQGQGYLHSQLAEAISLFQQDIEGMGVADRVVGMTYSEFGRRVNENGSKGTDHGTCAPMFIFGTGINGGLYGHDPKMDAGSLDIYGDLVNQFDFRQVYSAMLTQWFGADDAFRKSVLYTTQLTKSPNDFGMQFPLNGSGTMQNLIAKPADGVAPSAAKNFILYQNYPNPVRGETSIRFDLAQSGLVTLEVFDVRGGLVETVVNAYHGSGSYTASFDAGRLASGTYYYRLDAGGAVETKAMTLVR